MRRGSECGEWREEVFCGERRGVHRATHAEARRRRRSGGGGGGEHVVRIRSRRRTRRPAVGGVASWRRGGRVPADKRNPPSLSPCRRSDTPARETGMINNPISKRHLIPHALPLRPSSSFIIIILAPHAWCAWCVWFGCLCLIVSSLSLSAVGPFASVRLCRMWAVGLSAFTLSCLWSSLVSVVAARAQRPFALCCCARKRVIRSTPWLASPSSFCASSAAPREGAVVARAP